jgi:hypothetical protein
VSSTLSAISIERRRRLAATLGLFSVLCVTIGIVATTGSAPGLVRVFAVISITFAVVLGLMGWGVSHSVRAELAERRLEAAIDSAIDEISAKRGSPLACGCGHDHDPTEMHVSDAGAQRPSPGKHARHAAGCEHDGSGNDCAHNCDTCVMREVLASLRDS